MPVMTSLCVAPYRWEEEGLCGQERRVRLVMRGYLSKSSGHFGKKTHKQENPTKNLCKPEAGDVKIKQY